MEKLCPLKNKFKKRRLFEKGEGERKEKLSFKKVLFCLI